MRAPVAAPALSAAGSAIPEITPPPYVPGLVRPDQHEAPRIRRSRRAALAVWWREIDRLLLFMVLALMMIGLVAVAAASPASARRMSAGARHYDDMYFFAHQLAWQVMGLGAMLGLAMLSRQAARRWGLGLGLAMLVALMLVPIIGNNVNGAKRWLGPGSLSLQPSEFMKPAFAICLAWIISWRQRDPGLPVVGICVGLTVLVGALLMAQPDFGSTALFVGVAFVMAMVAGVDGRILGGVAACGPLGIGLVYEFYANGRHRIDAFLGGGTAYDQVDLAKHTLLAGGWRGTGFMLGLHKMGLPEAHTDYIFSVFGEEFGLLWCMVIVLLYIAIVARVVWRMVEEEDLFAVLAATGLVAQLGGQAFINILVNLQLFPSKGMTLPLISYGGSSTLALCMGVGFLLAITRRNPYLNRDPYSPPAPSLREVIRRVLPR